MAILKLLKTAKDVHDYVKKPNNLDQQNEMILERLAKLEDSSHTPVFSKEERDSIIKRLDKLELDSKPYYK